VTVGATATVEAPPQPAMVRKGRIRTTANAAAAQIEDASGSWAELDSGARRAVRLRKRKSAKAKSKAADAAPMLMGGIDGRGAILPIGASGAEPEVAAVVTLTANAAGRPGLTESGGAGVIEQVAEAGAPLHPEKETVPLNVEAT